MQKLFGPLRILMLTRGESSEKDENLTSRFLYKYVFKLMLIRSNNNCNNKRVKKKLLQIIKEWPGKW